MTCRLEWEEEVHSLVCAVVPAIRLHLDVFSESSEAQPQRLLDVPAQGLLCRRCVEPIRPVPLLMQK